ETETLSPRRRSATFGASKSGAWRTSAFGLCTVAAISAADAGRTAAHSSARVARTTVRPRGPLVARIMTALLVRGWRGGSCKTTDSGARVRHGRATRAFSLVRRLVRGEGIEGRQRAL